MSQQELSLEERLQRELELNTGQATTREAAQSAVRNVEERKRNPELADKLSDPDVDTEKFSGVEDEFGAALSSQHIWGHRPPAYEEEQSYLAPNLAERIIIERSPGRLLREHPIINAAMQGVNGPDDPGFVEPIKPGEERALYAAAEVGANMKSMAVEGKGRDSLMTATVENRQVTNEFNQEESAREKAGGLLR